METSSNLIQTLQRYVPTMIVRRLVEDPSPIRQPSAERLAAVVMFADITDFTALADRLSQRNQFGPEDLADLLNDCLGRLIEIIHAYGGQVTKFAGDALIALWPVPPHIPRRGSEAKSTLADMACLATKCGLEIQQSMSDFMAIDGSRLFLQVGIGAGDVYSVHLGGVFDRWEFLLSGTPLVQMSLAKHQASPGHVVLSADVWSLVQNYCLGKPLPSGFVEAVRMNSRVQAEIEELPRLTEAARNGLQSYIPAAILSRLEEGHEEWISEIRRVTVMFIKLPGYGTSIKHPYMRTIPEAQAVMEALQKALYRYAGSINKFNVDDKGITLVAALGLPPLSHCDDAARAVHVALEMQEALEGLGRQSAIGITTGRVFCGPVGNKQRCEYTMVGTVVNMAARLMQAAEDRLVSSGKLSETLCDKTTYDEILDQTNDSTSLANRLAFKAVQLTGVKGMAQPVASYRPSKRSVYLQVGQRSLPETIRIAGLKKERSYLSERLRQLEAQKSDPANLLIIEGDSGSGKSQLIHELLIQAGHMKLHSLVSAGDALEQYTPYHAWQPIFEKIFGLERLYGDKSKLQSHVLSQLPPIRGERGFPAFAIRLAPLLNSVLSLGFPENHTTANMEPEVRQSTTHQFLLRLLQRYLAGEGGNEPEPALLIFENGHWLDEYSWRLILDLSQRVESVLILVATRRICERALNPKLRRVCRWLNQSSSAVRWIVLGNLSREDNLDLLRQQLGIHSLPESAYGVLQRKTGGHPLFSIELAQYWQKNGQVKLEGDSIILKVEHSELERLPVPKVTHQIITGRMERLSPSHQLILKVASVIGKEFSAANLARIYPVSMNEGKFLEALKTLEKQEFIASSNSDSELKYRFTCDFIQEVALSLLPRAKREQLAIRLDQGSSVVNLSTN